MQSSTREHFLPGEILPEVRQCDDDEYEIYFQRSDNATMMNMLTLTTISMIYDRKFSVWLPDGGIRQVGLQHLHLHVDVDDDDV